MHQIQILYSTKRGKQKQLRLQMPEHWNELTPNQLLKVIDISLNITLNMEQKKTMLLQLLANIPMKLFSQLNAFQVISIYDALEVFLNEPKLTINPFPVVRCGSWWKLGAPVLIGPADDFGNLSFEEFIQADDHYFDYCQLIKEGGKIEQHYAMNAVNRLIATLWRPAQRGIKVRKDFTNNAGDVRVVYDSRESYDRVNDVLHLPDHVRLAMLYYYIGSRQQLEDIYPNAFDHGGVSTNAVPDRESWLKMMGQMPNDKFGTIPEIGPQNMMSVLFFLDHFISENKKVKQ